MEEFSWPILNMLYLKLELGHLFTSLDIIFMILRGSCRVNDRFHFIRATAAPSALFAQQYLETCNMQVSSVRPCTNGSFCDM